MQRAVLWFNLENTFTKILQIISFHINLPSLRSRLRFDSVEDDDVWKLFKCVLSKLFATAVIELWLSRKSPVSAQTEKNKPE